MAGEYLAWRSAELIAHIPSMAFNAFQAMQVGSAVRPSLGAMSASMPLSAGAVFSHWTAVPLHRLVKTLQPRKEAGQQTSHRDVFEILNGYGHTTAQVFSSAAGLAATTSKKFAIGVAMYTMPWVGR